MILNNSLLYALCMMDAMPCNWNMANLSRQFLPINPAIHDEIVKTWGELRTKELILPVPGARGRYKISQKGREFIEKAVPVATCS